jgi:hypothetical protein
MKKHIFSIYTTVIFLLLSAVAYAQNPVFEGTFIPDQFAELEPHFYSYEIYSIETNPLHDFVHSKDDGVTFSLQLGDAHNWNIGIVPRDIRATNYILRVQTENGVEELPPGENLTFQGQLNEGDGGDVALTIDQDFIYGFVEQGEQSYFIEPLWYFVPDQPTNLFVVYSNNDVRPSEGKCGVNEMEQHKPQVPALNTAADRSGGCFTIELSIAADNSMFNKFGSTAAVQAHTLGVMNNVQTNYDNEFPDVIQFAIVEQFILGLGAPDPWTASTDAITLLFDFANWGPTGFTQIHDLGQLWTNRDFDGPTAGIAFLPGVCTTSGYHCISDFLHSANQSREIAAHEIGHNLGADHDAASSSNIMAPFVSTSNTWSTASINDIGSTVLSSAGPGGCLAGCCPATLNFTATISSGTSDFEATSTITATNVISGSANVTYDAGVAVNLNLGFSAQSGVIFNAIIDGCGGAFRPNNENTERLSENEKGATTLDNSAGKFVIRPNPAADRVTITATMAEDAVLSIFDLLGRQVFQGLYPLENNTLELDISAFKAGAYIVVLQDNIAVHTQKLVVQR